MLLGIAARARVHPRWPRRFLRRRGARHEPEPRLVGDDGAARSPDGGRDRLVARTRSRRCRPGRRCSRRRWPSGPRADGRRAARIEGRRRPTRRCCRRRPRPPAAGAAAMLNPRRDVHRSGQGSARRRHARSQPADAPRRRRVADRRRARQRRRGSQERLSDSVTITMRVKGSDLAIYHAGGDAPQRDPRKSEGRRPGVLIYNPPMPVPSRARKLTAALLRRFSRRRARGPGLQPAVDFNQALQVTDVSGGWFDFGIVDGKNKLVPSVTFRIKKPAGTRAATPSTSTSTSRRCRRTTPARKKPKRRWTKCSCSRWSSAKAIRPPSSPCARPPGSPATRRSRAPK